VVTNPFGTVVIVAERYIKAGMADMLAFKGHTDNMSLVDGCMYLQVTENAQKLLPLVCSILLNKRPAFQV
jgi:hypothetical protein